MLAVVNCCVSVYWAVGHVSSRELLCFGVLGGRSC